LGESELFIFVGIPLLDNTMQLLAECHIKKQLAPIEMLAKIRIPIRKSIDEARNDSTCILRFARALTLGWAL
jgi:hypothetical protein